MATATRRVATVEPDATDEGEEFPVGSAAATDAMVRQLQADMAAQQDLINKLLAEKGIPSDPVAAQIQALQDHVHAQANANPVHSDKYAPVVSYVDKLTSDALTTNQAAKASRLVAKLRAQVPSHELAYAHSLAEDLHTMTLDPEDD